MSSVILQKQTWTATCRDRSTRMGRRGSLISARRARVSAASPSVSGKPATTSPYAHIWKYRKTDAALCVEVGRFVLRRKQDACACETLSPSSNKVRKAMFTMKVTVNVTRSLPFSFKRKILLWSIHAKYEDSSINGSNFMTKVGVDNIQTKIICPLSFDPRA